MLLLLLPQLVLLLLLLVAIAVMGVCVSPPAARPQPSHMGYGRAQQQLQTAPDCRALAQSHSSFPAARGLTGALAPDRRHPHPRRGELCQR